MTQELIPLTVATIGTEEQKTVNARDLHAFLEIGKDFSTWIKGNIEKYGFVEGLDFVKVPAKSSSPVLGSQEKIEYFLSIGMAKEIAMLTRNAKGKQARLYFIKCEEELKAVRLAVALPIPAGLPNFNDAAEAAIAWGQTKKQLQASEKKNEELTKRLQLAAPKEEAYDDLIDDKGTYTTTAIAKMFNMKRCELFTWFGSNKVAYQQGDKWLPYFKWVNKKWAVVIVKELNNKKTGEPLVTRNLRFTVAGIFQMHKMMQAQKINVPEQLDLDI